jgi:hypothetical protein
MPAFDPSEGLRFRKPASNRKKGILPSEESSVADQKKCAHPSCSCMTDKKYCSTYCEEHKNTSEIACDCGHPGCKGKL